ncbi:MAG: hypothetical protein KJT01_02675 [Gemmatimonadetes bacterium]|nr:hypothetical protein [Gemmatimonadota bacterium]
MSLNRRNYYRMLYVQPDAPFPVIKAAYRTLAVAEERATGSTSALLTEAYTVLSDPVLRAAYDAKTTVRTRHSPMPASARATVSATVSAAAEDGPPTLTVMPPRHPMATGIGARRPQPSPAPAPTPRAPGHAAPAAKAAPTPQAPAAPAPAVAPPPAPAAAAHGTKAAPPSAERSAPSGKSPAEGAQAASVACPMCQTPRTGRVTADTRCAKCQAPLAPITRPSRPRAAAGNERRVIPRVGRTDWATLQAPWNAEPVRVRLRDLSADGISVYSSTRIAPGTRVRIGNERFDLVATVVGCRTVRHVYSLHARLETAWVAPKAAAS